LIQLDVMLPSIDGMDVCRMLRRTPSAQDVPIILLTARTTEDDKLRGFGAGADDYVTKPFSPRELVARLQAVLRRAGGPAASGDQVRVRDIVLHRTRHEVEVGGRAVALTPVEFRLLDAFLRAPGRAFTRAELVERAFGHDFDGLDRTVDAHVMNLRKKLEPDRARPSYIVTVYGVGYKLAQDGHD
jgi:DNA-binding response OmpR family regulator